MKKLLIASLLCAPMYSQAQNFYYDKPAILNGKLLKIKSLHPNQEVFGGNQIALALDQQINVDGDEGLVKTKLIQLVDYDDARYSSLFKKKENLYKLNAVSCFRSHTAHHTTKGLCVVGSS